MTRILARLAANSHGSRAIEAAEARTATRVKGLANFIRATPRRCTVLQMAINGIGSGMAIAGAARG